jgi:hypothetical protein
LTPVTITPTITPAKPAPIDTMTSARDEPMPDMVTRADTMPVVAHAVRVSVCSACARVSDCLRVHPTHTRAQFPAMLLPAATSPVLRVDAGTILACRCVLMLCAQ